MCAPASRSRVSVLVVDSDPLVRAHLTTILGADDRLGVITEVADGTPLADAVAAHRPDVVLLDALLPGLDRITEGESAPKAVILATELAEQDVVEALRVGVSGFLLKDAAAAELVPAVLAAATGEVVLCQPVVRSLVTMVLDAVDARRDRSVDLARGLCGRELEVARLVGEGMSNPEIGRELSISVAMVKVHVSRLLVKLGLQNRVQIAVFADSAGLAVRSDCG
ncbi:response regulator [Kutzneria sp. CA-103260]|uniref:response regulator n=1 Tax=Kutzneria sp. CA-103260 TaxID=2802641 RepID=UPI001BA7AC3F|nr:response regulator transcription factor [Kutzneria sp. CA-103260]QUQ72355.1 response regulator transcription factor [Kutzneria sp. CA-103260]